MPPAAQYEINGPTASRSSDRPPSRSGVTAAAIAPCSFMLGAYLHATGRR